ncbi:hypothetical protein BC827DRAFT_1216806 [Russula dissimulans]|nr:hypothetical protein BC827DRAFT_1216806 [Russula dissimulans]
MWSFYIDCWTSLVFFPCVANVCLALIPFASPIGFREGRLLSRTPALALQRSIRCPLAVETLSLIKTAVGLDQPFHCDTLSSTSRSKPSPQQAMGIPLVKAELISLALTTFLYGVFFTLSCVTVAFMSLHASDSVRRQRTKVLPALLLLFVVATSHFIVLWVRAELGFVVQKGGSTLAFYSDLSDKTSIAKVICLCLQTLPADLINIWRLYVVYGKRYWVAAVPVLLVLSYAVVGFVAVWYITIARPGTDIFDVAKSWITAYFSLTVSTNVICSGAIALRIFLVGKPLPTGRVRVLWPILFVLIESSALYALGVLAALVSFLSGSDGQYAAVDAIVPLVGIVFCLIVLQIRFHTKSMTTLYSSEPELVPMTGDVSSHSPAGEESRKRVRSNGPIVHVTKHVHILDGLSGSTYEIGAAV